MTESLAGHPGFSLAAAACQLNSYPAANTGTASNPQSIAQIQRNQDWFCTFNNVFNKSTSTTATVIHNAAHATVTSVPAGTIVHDQATVTGGAGDADGDGDVPVVHERHLHRTRGGDVVRVHARRLWCRGRDDVHADAR